MDHEVETGGMKQKRKEITAKSEANEFAFPNFVPFVFSVVGKSRHRISEATGVSPFRSLRSSSGFTLLELLVVIAIIAVIASLLLPTLSRSKQKANSLACWNNLKQMQAAWEMYTGDHNGYMPPNEEGRRYGQWEGVRNSWVLGNAQRDDSTDNIKRGSLFPYLGNPDIYQCPSDRARVVGKPDLDRFRSYSLNGELNYGIGADQMYGLPILQSFHKVTDLKRPLKTYGFLDVTADTIDSGSFGLPGPAARTEEELKRNLLELDRNRWLHLPGYRHMGGANLSFLDGHVEYKEWEFQGREYVSPYGYRPGSDADMNDMRWLVQHGAAWQRYFP